MSLLLFQLDCNYNLRLSFLNFRYRRGRSRCGNILPAPVSGSSGQACIAGVERGYNQKGQLKKLMQGRIGLTAMQLTSGCAGWSSEMIFHITKIGKKESCETATLTGKVYYCAIYTTRKDFSLIKTVKPGYVISRDLKVDIDILTDIFRVD